MNPVKTLREFINTDFTTEYKVDTEWSTADFHSHDVFEVYYSMSDGIKFFIGDKVYPVEKGDIFIFNHLDLHKCMVPANTTYKRYIMIFRPEFIQDLSTPSTDLLDCFLNRGSDFCHRIHPAEQQSQAILQLLRKAESCSGSLTAGNTESRRGSLAAGSAESRSNSLAADSAGICGSLPGGGYSSADIFGKDIYRKIILAEILLHINLLYRSSAALPCRHEANYIKVKPILQYIRHNLQSDLSLAHLTSTFYMSKSYMGSIFKKATGFSVNEYIINCRIIKAKELLRKGMQVSKVAEMVGFRTDTHFIRTFSHMVGIPPKQYAKTTGF